MLYVLMLVLVNPPNTLPDHTHSITPTPEIEVKPSGDASVLESISIGNFK